MELWDLYDENRQPLNRKHNRKDKMALGQYHIVAEIWTVNHEFKILLTLRHPQKELWPNKWENTGGSILSGESSQEGAIRELREETGIIALESELVLLGSHKEKTTFVDTYIICKNVNIEHLTLQEGETIDAQWVSMNALDEMIENKLIAQPVSERLALLRTQFENYFYRGK